LTSIWSIRSLAQPAREQRVLERRERERQRDAAVRLAVQRVLQERGELLGRRRGAAVDVRDVGGHAEDVGAQADLGDVGLAVAVLEAVVLGDAGEAVIRPAMSSGERAAASVSRSAGSS
jgi:hypothetical protein